MKKLLFALITLAPILSIASANLIGNYGSQSVEGLQIVAHVYQSSQTGGYIIKFWNACAIEASMTADGGLEGACLDISESGSYEFYRANVTVKAEGVQLLWKKTSSKEELSSTTHLIESKKLN